MPKTSDTSKKMIMVMCTLFIIECVGALVFFKNLNSSVGFFIGLFIGTSLSIVKLILMEQALIKSFTMEKKPASNYINKQYFFRYLATIVILVISAINHPTINLFGVGIGLINMQVSAYIFGLFLNKDSNN